MATRQIWIKAPFIFLSDYIFTSEEILVFKLFPAYLFPLLLIVVAFLFWARIGFDFSNVGMLVALPFVALAISVPITYTLAFWKRRKLSPLSIQDISSRVEIAESIKWSQIETVALRNWQLSIFSGKNRRNLFLRFSQAEQVERLVKLNAKNARWSALRTRYSLVFASIIIVVADMAFLGVAPESWSNLAVAAGVMAIAFGLPVYAVLRPRIVETFQDDSNF